MGLRVNTNIDKLKTQRKIASEDSLPTAEELNPTLEAPLPTAEELTPLSSKEYSPLESAGMGAVDWSTFGLADEAKGGITALLNKLRSDSPENVNAQLKAQGFSLSDDNGQTPYVQARNEARGEYKKSFEDNPWSYAAGGLGGAIATAPALPAKFLQLFGKAAPLVLRSGKIAKTVPELAAGTAPIAEKVIPTMVEKIPQITDQAVVGAVEAAPKVQNIVKPLVQRAKNALLPSATAAYGMSESNKPADVAKDVALGTAIGVVGAPVLETGLAALPEIANPIGQKLMSIPVVRAGWEGIRPMSKKLGQTYEDVSGKVIEFFSDDLLPNFAKVRMAEKLKNANELQVKLSDKQQALKTLEEQHLLLENKVIAGQKEQLTKQEQIAYEQQNAAIVRERDRYAKEITEHQQDYEKVYNDILGDLKGKLKQEEKNQAAQTKINETRLKEFIPEQLDNKVQNVINKVGDKLRKGYNDLDVALDNLGKTLGQSGKKFEFPIDDIVNGGYENIAGVDGQKARTLVAPGIRQKLDAIVKTAKATNKPDLESFNEDILSALEKYAGDGNLSMDGFRALLNTKTVGGKTVNSAISDLRNRSYKYGDEAQQYAELFREMNDLLRARQYDFVAAAEGKLGQGTPIADSILDLNTKYSNYSRLRDNWLVQSPIDKGMLENKNLQSRILQAGKKGFTKDDSYTADYLMREIQNSPNPEIQNIAGDLVDYNSKFKELADSLSQEPKAVTDLQNLIARHKQLRNIEDVAQQKIPTEMQVPTPMEQSAMEWNMQKEALENYTNKTKPASYVSPETQKTVDRIRGELTKISEKPEDVINFVKTNREVLKSQSEPLQQEIQSLQNKLVEINKPNREGFLNEILNDLDAGENPEKVQEKLKNLIGTGNPKENIGGVGTNVQVLKNFLADTNDYLSKYKNSNDVNVKDDIVKMQDYLTTLQTKIEGSDALAAGAVGLSEHALVSWDRAVGWIKEAMQLLSYMAGKGYRFGGKVLQMASEPIDTSALVNATKGNGEDYITNLQKLIQDQKAVKSGTMGAPAEDKLPKSSDMKYKKSSPVYRRGENEVTNDLMSKTLSPTENKSVDKIKEAARLNAILQQSQKAREFLKQKNEEEE